MKSRVYKRNNCYSKSPSCLPFPFGITHPKAYVVSSNQKASNWLEPRMSENMVLSIILPYINPTKTEEVVNLPDGEWHVLANNKVDDWS